MAPGAPPAASLPVAGRRFALAAGGVLLFIALAVASGWFLREPRLVQALPGYLMVFNTALCFALAGLALLCNAVKPPLRTGLQAILGTLIVLGAGAVLLQYLMDTPFGIDWPGLHRWMLDSNPHPGRMAPATCVGFLLSGAGFTATRQAGLARVLAGLVMIIGILALTGYALGLDVMFELYLFGQVSGLTAACLLVLGLAQWRSTNWPAWERLADDHRIVLDGTAILVAFGFVLSLVGLAAVKTNFELAVRSGLVLTAQGRAALLVNLVDGAIDVVDTFAARPSIVGLFDEQAARRDEPARRAAFARVAEVELDRGYSALEFRDARGAVVATAGRVLDASHTVLALRRPHGAKILWNRGFLLHIEVPVAGRNGVTGTVVAQQRLPAVASQVLDVVSLGRTGEIALCSADAELLHCAPQRFRQTAFELPRQTSPATLPMIEAVRGRTGTMTAPDYRGRTVFAAHMPAGDLGLGMVLKIDAAELYEPLRRQLAYTAPLMLLLLAGGILALRMLVRPLANRLHASERRLSLALNATRLALWDWDVRTGAIYLSEQWQVMLGGEPRATVTTLPALRALVHPEDGPNLDEHLRHVLKGEAATYDVEHRVRKPDGGWIWIRSCGEVVQRTAKGRAMRLTGTNADISVRKSMQDKLVHQATHDALTGLPNRVLFYDRLAHAISRSRRTGELLAVIYTDVDNFKKVNDTLGHGMGDALLQHFAQRLARSTRAMDTVARLGGDEFAVILEGLGHRDDGCSVAAKIVEEMRPPFAIDGRALTITTSVGIAFFDGSRENDAEGLLKQADAALYAAKGEGRNNYQVFDDKAKVENRKEEGKNVG